MTAAAYKAARQQLGTLKEVAELLGVHWITVQRRETRALKITTEAALAISAAGAGRKKPRAKTGARK